MSTTAPDLWPESLKPAAISPLALLRTQAGRLHDRTSGLLVGEVDTDHRGKNRVEHSLTVFAPALEYRRGVLHVAHHSPGAYPVEVESLFLVDRDEGDEYEMPTRTCATQEEFTDALRTILRSKGMSSLLDSLLAQINDAEAVTTSA